MASKEAIARMFVVFRANWPERQIEPETMRLYECALHDITDPVLEAAAMVCVNTCTFFPRVAEIRQAVQRAEHDASGYVSGQTAYTEALDYYASGGRTKPSNRLVLAALHYIGGISAIRMSEEPDWTRKAYIETYEALVEQEKRGICSPSEKELKRQIMLRQAREEAEDCLPAGVEANYACEEVL